MAALACALVLAASLVSCGGFDKSPATLEEYASWCTESSLLAVAGPQDRQVLAAGVHDIEDIAETLQELVKDYESIVPPAEVAAFHDHTLASLRAAAAEVDEAPSFEDAASAWEFDDLLAVVGSLRRVSWDVAGDLDGTASGLVLAMPVREALTASGCLPLLQPTAERYSSVGAAFVVSWEPVPGADSYTVYHDDFYDVASDDDFFGSGCRVYLDGFADFCNELAAEVLVTRYVHVDPSAGDNHYWVSACNRWHCTAIADEDPAGPILEPALEAAPDEPEPPHATTTATAAEISRADFEASAPEGYVPVTVRESGSVWGTPARFTSDSDPGAVAYLLLGEAGGCSVANAQAEQGATAYIRTAPLGDLPYFESATVCRGASDTWDSGWYGARITHLRVFDDASPTNVTEYVYDDETGQYVGTSPAPAARRITVSPADGSQEECSRQWARRPELSFAEAIEMCGGDSEALQAEHFEACANSDPSDAGLEWLTYGDFARDNETEGTARAEAARTAGDENQAAYFEHLADRYAGEAERTQNLADEAEGAERDRRAKIIAERGVASWPEACRQMTDELWALDLPGLAEVGADLVTHFGELGDLVCGGYSYDVSDLCGGIDLLEAGVDALAVIFDALGFGLEAFGEVLGGVGGVLEGIFSIFG